YRVCLRRTRSLLGQIKNIFTASAVEHFRTEFRWLAQATSTKRDLDVLSISLRRMAESLPDGDLATLLAFLSWKQLHEQRELERILESNRYRTMLKVWQDFLQDAPKQGPEPASAARPLVEVTSKRILRLYRRLVDHAMTIHEKTPADA